MFPELPIRSRGWKAACLLLLILIFGFIGLAATSPARADTRPEMGMEGNALYDEAQGATYRAKVSTKHCLGMPTTPKKITGGYRGEGRIFCIGWSKNTTRTWVTLEDQYFGHDSWILSTLLWRTEGKTSGSYSSPDWIRKNLRGDTVRMARVLRTCVHAQVIGENGLVLKRYGKVCSTPTIFVEKVLHRRR